MTLVLIEKGLVLEGFYPVKIEDSWVLGIYTWYLKHPQITMIGLSVGYLQTIT